MKNCGARTVFCTYFVVVLKSCKFIFNSRTIVLIDLNISKIGIKPRKNMDKRKMKNHHKVRKVTFRRDVNQL